MIAALHLDKGHGTAVLSATEENVRGGTKGEHCHRTDAATASVHPIAKAELKE